MEFVKHGKENCQYCKAMKESIIEEAFTESYKLLCNNNKEFSPIITFSIINSKTSLSNSVIISLSLNNVLIKLR